MSMASITFPINILNPDYDKRARKVEQVTLEAGAYTPPLLSST